MNDFSVIIWESVHVWLLCKPPLWPFFVLHISPTVVKENVRILGQHSLHYTDASVEEKQEILWMNNLLFLLVGEFSRMN